MKKNKIFSIVLTAIMCVSLCSVVFATEGFITTKVEPALESNEFGNTMSSSVKDILGFIQWICWAIAVGMIMYLGIRYMSAAANERADLKSSFMRYIIGALLIALTSTVFNAIWSIASSLN